MLLFWLNNMVVHGEFVDLIFAEMSYFEAVYNIPQLEM